MVSPSCCGWYPPGTKRVTIGPRAQIPRLVFIGTSTSGSCQPATGDGVERHGGEEDEAGDHVLDRGAVAEQVDAVRDGRDDERAHERADHPAAAAEQARPADHGSGDRVEEQRATAGRRVHRVEARSEDHPAHPRHQPRDHEDHDADPLDVDAGAARGLGVAADGVDVAAERRALRNPCPEDEEDDHEQEGEWEAAFLVGPDDRAKNRNHEDRELGRDEHEVVGVDPVPLAAHDASERAGGEQHGRAAGDQEPGGVGEEVVGNVVDRRVLDQDYACAADHLQDHALPQQQSRERDDERRDPDDRNERALHPSDQRGDTDSDRDGDHALHLPAPVWDLELCDDHPRDARDEADREVDLAQEQNEDDADRDRRHAGHLGHEVREVAGAQIVVVLQIEEQDDPDQPEDDRQRADVAGFERLVAAADDGAEVVARRDGVDGLRLDAHAVGSSAAIPATLVATPAVIAWTTSCWVVSRRL